jgi:hypothetical protein
VAAREKRKLKFTLILQTKDLEQIKNPLDILDINKYIKLKKNKSTIVE